jgi:ABC-type multidrug transport system fused ATPase/permease subunit
MILYSSIGGAIIAIKVLYPGQFLELIPFVGTFAIGVFLVLPKIASFGSYITSIMNLLPDIEMLRKELMETRYSSIKNGTKPLASLSQGISLRNVSFAHKNRETLLNDINLDIKKDTVTALVGPSGSGKSTIINLLLRLYDTKQGSVNVDGIDIKDLDISSYLKHVGYVSQDTFIFNGSIKDNISFGEAFLDAEIIEAAIKANAHSFIEQLPQGYDTIVGDRGMRLSGGEQQRIAIARAIIRKPEIMIMDEATSSLDNVSERIVKQAIDDISKSCTTFIVAHRLTTIQDADIIYVLDKGRIVESGNHEELLNNRSHYYSLYKGQEN